MPNLSFLGRRASVALLGPVLAAFGLMPHQALATHGQGSDLSYVNVSPGVYVVTYKFYRDCSGIPAPLTQYLDYRGTGCGTTGTDTNAGGSLVLNKISSSIGQPYGDPAMNICLDQPGSPQNYEEHVYQGTLTLGTAATGLCTDWVLGISECNRPNVRNLAMKSSAGGECLYSMVRLNNRDAATDNSPVFGAHPIPFVHVGLTYNYSQSVVDPDGDSLSFMLVPGLSTATNVVAYDTGFSASNPILTSTPFLFDQQTGQMNFTPSQYVPITVASPSDEGLNKYALVVQADSWRTINGQPVRVSSVRRDVLVIVIDSSASQALPRLTQMAVNGTPTPLTTVVDVDAGQPMEMLLVSMDPNLNDRISMVTNASAVLTGSTFTGQSGIGFASGILSWTPSAAQARARPYYFTITTEDNSHVRGFDMQTIAVRVRPSSVTGLAAPHKVAIGTTPNPFTDAASLTVNVNSADRTPTIFIYDGAGRLVDRVVVSGTGEQRVTWRPTADLKPGLYYARYEGAGARQTAVLCKQ